MECPKCSAAVSADDRVCPFCGKMFDEPVAVDLPDVDGDLIRRKRNLFCWLFLACLLIGGINIFLAFQALKIGWEEVPELTFRDVRFERVEIESPKYRQIRNVMSFLNIGGEILGIVLLYVYVQWLWAMDYSNTKTLLITLGTIFLPIVNMVILLSVFRHANILIRQEKRRRDEEGTQSLNRDRLPLKKL